MNFVSWVLTSYAEGITLSGPRNKALKENKTHATCTRDLST